MLEKINVIMKTFCLSVMTHLEVKEALNIQKFSLAEKNHISQRVCKEA